VSVLTPGRNLVLVGMTGAGKTTVGRLTAERLARPFVDTDAVVEREQGATVAELFAAHGERRFRELEAAAVRRATALRGQVVAVGGGAVEDPQSVTALRGTGDVAWLDAPVGALVLHLSAEAEAGRRPLLASAVGDPAALERRLEDLLHRRAPAYRAAADVVVATGGRPPEVVADQVLAWARTRPGLLSREEQRALDEGARP
jgi:shikimate kinase